MLNGYASDGGMFLPEKIPKLSHEDLVANSMLDYVNLCREIVKQFTSEEEYGKLNLHGTFLLIALKAHVAFKAKPAHA